MNCKLTSVLTEGMTFSYEYDFGSTTELMITVVNYRIGISRKEKIVILSRNNQIEFLCDECGKKPAVYICTECIYEGAGWLCSELQTGKSISSPHLCVLAQSSYKRCGVNGTDLPLNEQGIKT